MMLSSRAIYSAFLLVSLLVSLLASPSFAKEVAKESAQETPELTNGTTSREASAATSAETEKQSSSSSDSAANSAVNSGKIKNLLERLAINQGKGHFVQNKHFSFMSVPITSTGHFIVKGQSALWQTQEPVFSALLLTPKAIYRRLSLDDNYQLLTDSAEFSGVLSTIFTGKVNADDWLINNSTDDTCLELMPKSEQLKGLFQQVDLCLINESDINQSAGQAINNSQQQRQITLTDSKGDKTVIRMTLSNDLFVPRDFEALKHTSNQPGNISDN